MRLRKGGIAIRIRAIASAVVWSQSPCAPFRFVSKIQRLKL